MVWLLCFPAVAAPVLRLSQSALVWYPGGAATQSIRAGNAGDGVLDLTAAVQNGANWLKVTIDSQTLPNFISLNFSIDVSRLARGTYTTRVTISDPQAIDAPQVVTATAQVGGGDPITVDQYIAPGKTSAIPFYTGSLDGHGTLPPAVTTDTQDGGSWLAVSFDQVGTFGPFYRTEYIQLAPPASMPPGTYSGSVTLSNYAARTIPVTMRVTTQPIAVPSTAQIDLRLAAGGPAASYPFLPAISLTNSGMGTLEVQGVSVAGAGVAASLQAGQVVVAVDPASRGPGIYNDGMITIQCNGANCPVQVPVSLEIVPQTAPTIAYLGVVDNAKYLTAVAPGDVCIVTGEQLSLQDPATAAGFPLPTNLGGATVRVNDMPAPLYYTSFGQVAFQMPYSTAVGTALVKVERNGVLSNTVSVDVEKTRPQILVITDSSYQLRDATHPTKVGETLIIWMIGLGATSPPVDAGAAAPLNPPAVAVVVPQVSLSDISVIPSFVGLSGGSAGLYQLIVTVPPVASNGWLTVQISGVSWVWIAM